MFIEKPIRVAMENIDDSTTNPLSICHKSLLSEDPFEHDLNNASLLRYLQGMDSSWNGCRLPVELQGNLLLISESYTSAQEEFTRFVQDLRLLDIEDFLERMQSSGRIKPSEVDLALSEISRLAKGRAPSDVIHVVNDKKESWIRIFFKDEIEQKESVCNRLRKQLSDCLADIEAYTIRPSRMTTAKDFLYELSAKPLEDLEVNRKILDSLGGASDVEVLHAATSIMTEVFGEGWKTDYNSRVSALSAKVAWNEHNWNRLGTDREAHELQVLYWRPGDLSKFYGHLEHGIHPINNHLDKESLSMGSGQIGRVTCCGSPSVEYPECNYFILDTSRLRRESIRFAGNHYPCYFDFIPPDAIVGIFQGSGYYGRPTISKQPEKESIIPLLRRAIFYHRQELFLPVVPRKFLQSVR